MIINGSTGAQGITGLSGSSTGIRGITGIGGWTGIGRPHWPSPVKKYPTFFQPFKLGAKKGKLFHITFSIDCGDIIVESFSFNSLFRSKKAFLFLAGENKLAEIRPGPFYFNDVIKTKKEIPVYDLPLYISWGSKSELFEQWLRGNR